MQWKGANTIRVEANGINFEIVTMGTGDRVALCLHGFPEHAYSWRYQAPLLAELGYRVWVPNLRGYGGTDAPQQVSAYATETLVADIVQLIKKAGAERVLVLGHDWGGFLAWLLAMEYPSVVERLIILNAPHPTCFLRELKRWRQRRKSKFMYFFQIPVLPEILMGMGKCRYFAETMRRTACDPSKFPDDVIEVFRANAARPGGLTAMFNWYRGLFRGGGLRRIRGWGTRVIAAPTLHLWGDADVFFVPEMVEETVDYVPNLTFRRLSGVSHWIQQEAPEAVNEALVSWLAGS